MQVHTSDDVAAVRNEVFEALELSIPDRPERNDAVEWLFQQDPRAPYALALQVLTGHDPGPAPAREVWEHAIEIQHKWSQQLHDAVTMSAAATEAIARFGAGKPANSEDSLPSLRSYLERDLPTGLHHNSHYSFRLWEEVARSHRTGQPVSLLHLRLTGLADKLQHLGEDEREDTLRNLGEVLRHCARPADIPCRCAEEDFAFILPGTSAERAVDLGHEVVHGLKDELPRLRLRYAIGVAECPRNAYTASALRREAVKALRHAEKGASGQIAASSRVMKAPPRWDPAARQGSRLALSISTGLAAGLIVVGIASLVLRKPSSPVVSSLPRSFAPDPSPVASRPKAKPAPVAPLPPVASGPTARQALLTAAAPRTRGDYSLAAQRLEKLARSSTSPQVKADAYLAAAAADCAGGLDASAVIQKANALAGSLGHGPRLLVRARTALVTGCAAEARGHEAQAANYFWIALNNADTSEVQSQAGIRLVDSELLLGRRWRAAWIAGQVAASSGRPEVRAAFGIIAAVIRGQSQDALRTYLLQPGALAVPGGAGDAAADYLAQAMTQPAGAGSLITGEVGAQALGSDATNSAGARLRVALAWRLLERQDSQGAVRVLAPLLSKGAGPIDPNVQRAADVLNGLAQWRSGAPKAALSNWRRSALMPARPDAEAVDLWDPAPSDSWWQSTASLLLGHIRPSDYSKLLTASDALHRNLGAEFLRAARYTQSASG